MKTVAIIAARTGSTRLPGKVLFPLSGKPVLQWVIEAALAARTVDDVYVATTTEPQDDAIEIMAMEKVCVYRGSEADVLRRYAECAREAEADIIIRLTGDCCFADPNVIDQVVTLRRITEAAYAQNVSPPTWPDGLDVECFTREALEMAHKEATRPSDRDCLTQYLERNRLRFKNSVLICPIPGLGKERWVLDTEDDLAFCRAVADHLPKKPPSYLQMLKILDKYPKLRNINATGIRNERFYASVSHE